VIACSMFLICCKYYLGLLLYRPGEWTCSVGYDNDIVPKKVIVCVITSPQF